jgi:TolA-binding protein
MRHLRLASGSRNAGFVAADSALAFIIIAAPDISLAHAGISPQRIKDTPTTPKTTGGIRTAIEDISNEVKAKSQKLYQQLDRESGGRWQRYEDQINNLNDKLDEVNGIDDEAYDRLETKRNDIETSQAQMLEDLKDKGVDPDVADDAVAHYKQAMALRDLDKAVKGSTAGDARVGLKETVDPKKFVTRVQKLYDSGRLEQALGKDGANALVKEAYAAKGAKSLQTVAKWTAGILAARYAGGSVLHNILTAASMVQ